MLVNWEECGTQLQLRSDQDILMAASADPSYLSWQGVPHSIGTVPNLLSHPSGQSPSDTPESLDDGQLRLVPYHEGVPRHHSGLSIFSGGGPSYDPGGDPLVFQVEVPLVHLDPMERSLRPPSFQGEVFRPPGLSGPAGGGPPAPSGPPNGGPLGPSGTPGGISSDPLVTQDLKALPNSCSCSKVVPH